MSREYLKNFVLFACLLFILCACRSQKIIVSDTVKTEAQINKIEQLRNSGLPEEFIGILTQDNSKEERNRIVQKNVLGFLAKADYSGHYSKKALLKCAEFLRKYKYTLKLAEEKYEVPRQLITALLWVETKYGQDLGRRSLAQVYFYLLQSDEPSVMADTLIALKQRMPEANELTVDTMILRSKDIAARALVELQALHGIYHNNIAAVTALKGSYAGAFGIPQFIPSSYLQWARAKNEGKKPDLFNTQDAIMSVANYLKANGWINKDDDAMRRSLFHYNRAQGYVDVILKLAAAIEGP